MLKLRFIQGIYLEMTNNITPVILCGGSGTRLWPLSRKSFPKQFVPLIGKKSLLQLTLERVATLGKHVYAVAAEDHRFMVEDTMQSCKLKGTILLEPAARNTAAAMAFAALHAAKHLDAKSLLLFCPADHHIPDIAAFKSTITQGKPAAESGAIVTFGISPTYPSTGYGYIEQGTARSDGSADVTNFIEKPDADKAQHLLLQGNFLWNAGIFLTRIDVLLQALAEHAPDILAACQAATAELNEETLGSGCTFVRPEAKAFTHCRAQSIDYAVMEPHHNVAVVPFKGQWSDVGSWDAVANMTPADANNNHIEGTGITHEAKNNFIHAPHRPVVLLGVEDLLVIDTPDAVLVAHRGMAEQVKEVVAILEAKEHSEAVTHRKVARPWGWYDSIDLGERFQVKRIGVKAGASLSLQKHHHRAEHWIVVKGTAEVTCGDKVFLISENQSTYIPIGEKHRLKNPGKVELEIIEVQSGGYLGEDDIVRFEDVYGRGS